MREITPALRSKKYSCPGKVFLLGEYAVLSSGPGVLAAVAPRFTLETSPSGLESIQKLFAPQSPAGVLLSRLAPQLLPRAVFIDPHQGAGGFGASTAQFILSAAALDLDMDFHSLWQRYRDQSRQLGQAVPSGADLIAQLLGGFVFFDGRRPQNSCSFESKIAGSHFLIFSATGQENRKTATHLHLADLEAKGFPRQYAPMLADLENKVNEGKQALERGDLEKMGQVLEDYGDILAKQGLEVKATAEDRRALRVLKGVLGVKGSGALQSDALIVLVENPASDDTDQILQVAGQRGLQCIARGLQLERGWTC